MTKLQFLRRMHFPVEWRYWEMYPDILYEKQLAAYEPGNEMASEHHRNGAFHWWLKQGMSSVELLRLVFLTIRDPDQMMAADVRRYISLLPALPSHIAEFLTAYKKMERALHQLA